LGGVPIKELTAEIGYWRNAEQIHRWFVRNVQGGKDECEKYYVSRNQLKGLKAACQQVLDPTYEDDSGRLNDNDQRFVGLDDCDYDDYKAFEDHQGYGDLYYKKLERTLKIIEIALAAMSEGWGVSYKSAW